MNTALRILAFLLVLGFPAVVCAGNHEIPVTTTSDAALKHFVTGRDLFERLRTIEATPHFEQAIAMDKDFAQAYLYLAQCATSNKMFIENLNKATALAPKVSEGERLLIKGMEASFTGNTAGGEKLLRDLVNLFPDDVRGRIMLANTLQQQLKYEDAIQQCKNVVRIDPRYPPVYNTVGYLYAYTENYTEAEQAFKKYTDLIPGEPNPLDSYAELLMKEGKFDESIETYERALAIDPKFYSSVVGIALDYAMKGMPAEARKRLQQMFDGAPDDGVRRQALTAMMMVSLHEGKYDRALEEVKKRQAIAEKNQDVLETATDIVTTGDILLETSTIDVTRGTFLKTRSPEVAKVQEAGANYSRAIAVIENSTLSQTIRDAAQMGNLFAETRVAIHNNDVAGAKLKADGYRAKAVARNEPPLIQNAHLLAGLIALTEKRNQDALTELNQSNLRDPIVLLRLSEANEGLGNTAKAREWRNKAANFNENNFHFALIRRMVHD